MKNYIYELRIYVEDSGDSPTKKKKWKMIHKYTKIVNRRVYLLLLLCGVCKMNENKVKQKQNKKTKQCAYASTDVFSKHNPTTHFFAARFFSKILYIEGVLSHS